MSHWIRQWVVVEESMPLLAAVLACSLRVAAIVFVAWIIQRIAKRWSSSFRLSVWIFAFCALVLLIPQWLTAIPLQIPIRIAERAAPIQSADAERRVAVENQLGLSRSETMGLRPFDTASAISRAQTTGGQTVTLPADSIGTRQRRTTASPADLDARPWVKRPDAVSVLVAVYGIGLFAWLARIVRSWVQLRSFAEQATMLPQSQSELALGCARRFGLRSTPDCRLSGEVKSPLTFGIFHPVILVPTSFTSYTVDQQRHCLLHEIAHIAQRDACWNWLAEVTTALYWFHPCVHWARVNLRRLRENAADDAVVRSGESAASYARSLLEITQAIIAPSSQPVAAIHSGTDLQHRIGRIVDPSLRLDQQPRWIAALVGVGLLLLASTGLSVQTVLAQQPASDGKPLAAPAKERQAADAADPSVDRDNVQFGLYARFKAVEVVASVDEVPKTVDIDFHGRVTDTSGPIADAVVLIREFVAFRGPDGKYIPPPIVARTTTDGDGRYQVRGVPIVRLNSLGSARWEVLVADPTDRLGLGAYALSSFVRRQSTPWNASIDIQLPGSEQISAQVVTPAGGGIGDVRVAVKEISVPESVDYDAGPFMRGSQHGFPNQPHVYRFPSDELHLLARTDSSGHFAFQMPKNASLVLGIRQDESFPRLIRLSAPGYQTGIRTTRVADQFTSPATIELRRLFFVSVTIDDDAGDPVNQYTLSALTPQGKTQSQRFQISDDGKLRTTAEFIREAAGVDGRLELLVRFPFQSGLLPLAKSSVAESVIQRRDLRFQARRGIRASGRVVREDDGTGIANVEVCWHRQAGRINDTLLRCTTDAQGEWQMVIPKDQGYLSVVGSSPGLDLWTTDRFNADASGQQQVTQRIAPSDLSDRKISDFRIASIPTRRVTVVDTDGSPVEGVWVHSEFIETLERDNRTYHLPQTLAESSKTGPDGRCSLVLHRSTWEHGAVRAMKIDDDDPSTRPRFTAALTTITPNSDDPIKLVLRSPWVVMGRVLLNGEPATGLHVGLTTRLIGSGEFGHFETDTVPISEDGSFQVQAIAGLEYAVAVRQDTEAERKYFYWQSPIAATPSGRVNLGTLTISSDQLKTHQQIYDERYTGK